MFGEIRNAQGEKLDYSLHKGETDSGHLAIIGHGVTGNKDRPFLVALAKGLSEAGISALRISFSGNGNSEGTFTESNISKEVADLGSVLDALSEKKISYIGHSMGGAVGTIRASRDSRIAFLVSLAGMVHTRQFAETQFGMIKPDEGNMWEDDSHPLSSNYMRDLCEIGSTLSCAKCISIPWLILHGSEDDVVPIQDSKDIYDVAGSSASFVSLPGSNHIFEGKHTAFMVEKVVAWLRKSHSNNSNNSGDSNN